jgi:hypothetical protein
MQALTTNQLPEHAGQRWTNERIPSTSNS